MTAQQGVRPPHFTVAEDARSASITLLTTEHYNLQTQRATTITEANGRASIFLGALSAGLIALGFQASKAGDSAGTTIFRVLVLSSLAFLGIVTFLRCVEVAIDDWQFSNRIARLRAAYLNVIPELSDSFLGFTDTEQGLAMLPAHRQRLQLLLTVAGSVGVITSIVIGTDIGVLIHGIGAPLILTLPAGSLTALLGVSATVHFQCARWTGAAAPVPELVNN